MGITVVWDFPTTWIFYSFLCQQIMKHFPSWIFEEDLLYFFKCCFGISLLKVRKLSQSWITQTFVLIWENVQDIICLKKIDSVQLLYLHWSVFRNWKNWKLEICDRNIAFYRAIPKRYKNLSGKMDSVHFKLPLKWISAT